MRIPEKVLILLFVISAVLAGAAARAELLPGDIVGSIPVRQDAGKDINLGKVGKVYVLAFFIPGGDKDKKQLLELQKLLGGKGFAGVDSYAITRGVDEDEQAKARVFLKTSGVKTKLLFEGKELPAAKKFGTRYFPMFYIVDQKGVVREAVQEVTGKVRKFSFSEILSKIAAGQTVPYVDLLPVDPHEKETREMIGKPAPDFSLLDMNQKTRSISSLKGKKNIMLVYWSPQCPHCLRELPQVQQYYLSRRFDFEFEVYAVTTVSTEEGKKALNDVLTRNMFTFPVIVDKEAVTSQKYKVGGVPCVFFIDKKGIVREALIGETKNLNLAYNSIFNDPERLGNAKK